MFFLLSFPTIPSHIAPSTMLFRLCKDGAEVLDARVDAVAHLAAVGGLVGARKHRGVVPLANLLHAGLQRLALYKIKCYLLRDGEDHLKKYLR